MLCNVIAQRMARQCSRKTGSCSCRKPGVATAHTRGANAARSGQYRGSGTHGLQHAFQGAINRVAIRVSGARASWSPAAFSERAGISSKDEHGMHSDGS